MARPDIKLLLDDVESCWVEIEPDFNCNSNKNIIVGCIYRHPRSNIQAYIVIEHLIKRQLKGQISPSRLIRNDNIYTDKHDIANQFNQHFVHVGPNLASKLDTSTSIPTTYMEFTYNKFCNVTCNRINKFNNYFAY